MGVVPDDQLVDVATSAPGPMDDEVLQLFEPPYLETQSADIRARRRPAGSL